jgi:hypothetical protein
LKKTIPISLLILFVLNLVGYYIAFPVVSICLKGMIRASMETNFVKKDLVLIKIPLSLERNQNADFQKTEVDEFQYFGKMYDVSDTKVAGDTTYYYCFNDHDEEKLIADLDDHIKTDIGVNAPTGKNGKHDLIKKPVKEYLKTTLINPVIFGTVFLPDYFQIRSNYVSVLTVCDTPPPESRV